MWVRLRLSQRNDVAGVNAGTNTAMARATPPAVDGTDTTVADYWGEVPSEDPLPNNGDLDFNDQDISYNYVAIADGNGSA